MKKLLFASTLAALSLATAGAASAVTLNNIQGQILVNGVPGTEGQALATGDVVTVGEQGGEASVVLAEGCALSVKPGQVVTVPAEFKCAPPVAGGINPTHAAIAAGIGLLAGGGIGYAIGDDNNDHHHPASP
jgi:opacity protein-like surface antigen